MLKVTEIKCKLAISKTGLPDGDWAINPYIGCQHACVYCYARFMKRFTGHSEAWGTFVDVRINIAEVLRKQFKSPTYQQGIIIIGTVTDPYQPIERKYQLTRKILQVLKENNASAEILTKSDLVVRDLDLLKSMKKTNVSFTITTLDAKWQKLTEPNSSSAVERLKAIKKLTSRGVKAYVMIGPYWPVFTDPDKLFIEFKKVGISQVFSESFNTVGGNWTGVEKVLAKHYPKLLHQIKDILFDKNRFADFYSKAAQKIKVASKKYQIPITTYFGNIHGNKFLSK